LLKKCASPDVTLHEVVGGYHELFMGPEKDDVMRRINQWILHQADLKEQTRQDTVDC
jgi:alpha-beta hydrolase superfamily lysophospholipase